MSPTDYDPEHAPEPDAWLALDESERLDRVHRFHVRAGVKVPSMPAHAAIHVIVENQLAMGEPPTLRALARLREGGLSRHDAVHAIGSVIAMAVQRLAANREPDAEATYRQRVEAEIEALTAEQWMRLGGGRRR